MEVSGQLHDLSSLCPGKKPPLPIGSSPRSGLDVVARRKKNPCPCRESNPCLPACSLVTILNELPRKLWCYPKKCLDTEENLSQDPLLTGGVRMSQSEATDIRTDPEHGVTQNKNNSSMHLLHELLISAEFAMMLRHSKCFYSAVWLLMFLKFNSPWRCLMENQ
jgi:hypothetical protein